jgi:hypothetical protein
MLLIISIGLPDSLGISYGDLIADRRDATTQTASSGIIEQFSQIWKNFKSR